MKKVKIISLLITICMLFSIIPFSTLAADEKIVIHVSASARFAGDGSEAKPFRTIEEAQAYVSSIEHRTKSVEVLVHGGIYPQELTLTFTAKDSGSKKYPVIYRSAGDGTVRISNAVKLNHMDFKAITDNEILDRLPAEARGKVGVLDLSEYKLDMNMFKVAERTTDPREHQMYPFVYLNGKMQEVAKWPNVGFETITTVIKTGELQSSGTKGEKGEWLYNNLRPERWTKADQAIIRGYLGTEYCMDSVPFGGVNLQSKSMYLKSKSTFGVKAGHRWLIENLLEEIDSPGEYFVDANTQKLYYYPPYKMKATDTLEISTFSKTYIKTDGASHIIFDGINVDGNVDNEGYHILNSDNITIRNTTIYNVDRGIYIQDSKNTLVEACTIYDINTTAVYTSGGGNIETLEHGNNRISNCHFYRWAVGKWMHSKYAVSLGRDSKNKTIGDVIENCIIHGQPNGQAVIYGGVENEIKYNEMYSITQDAADMGVIYAGRQLREVGSVISYNYLHDFAPIFEARYQVQGIYWDDFESGQSAHHNIIVPGGKNRTAGNLFVGADSYYCENIVVNSDIGVRATERSKAVMSAAYNSPKTGVSAALFEKYPAVANYRTELENNNMMFIYKNNVFENNLSVDVNKNTFTDNHINQGSFKNNQVSSDYGVFVDAANHDYRLKREYVKEFGFPDTFLNEDNFDMKLIGIQEDVMKVEKPSTPFRLLYPTNGQKNVTRNTAYIKWEEARFADIYEYVVATDPELKNVVASGKSLYNVVELPDLKNDTVYYYKVYAKNLSKQIGNTWESEGVPYMFKTAAEDILEKEMLNEKIKNLKDLKSKIAPNIGTALGQYKSETITAIDNLLAEAQRIAAKTTGSQEEIDAEATKISNFIDGISGYKRAGHESLNVQKNKWMVSSDQAVAVENQNDILTVKSLGSGWAYLNEPSYGYMVKHFKMKLHYNGYTMLSLKQSDPGLISYTESLKNYLLIIRSASIEFQKYNPTAGTTGIINTYPNDYIKEGEWVDVEYGCVDVPGGVNVIFKVNGNEVINYFDTQTPNFGDGYFVVHPGREGATAEFKAADPSSIPTTEFVFEGSAATQDGAKLVYNADSKIAVKTGQFTEESATTIDGSKVKVSADANAQVVYTVTDTEVPYKTYYYHKPVEGGDPNATISMVAYSPTSGGSTKVVRNVDFSKGEEGWVYLGTYECASAGRTGDIVFTIRGSGKGKLVAPVISVEKADKELLEFNRTFYDYSDNLLLMKIDSQKAYTVLDELTIPDTAPYIENGRTMVPLRFVSEAFGAQVDWNAETQTATITHGGNVVAFTLGSKAYTANGETRESETEAKLVNGRTMIPLRATVEALGKKVMWYGDARLIFIADNFGFIENDTVKFQVAAKGFDRGFN